MPTAQLILQRASKLPLLGLKAQPSPYVIIECQKKTHVSPIFKYSQNPLWDYNCHLQTQELTSFVHFYVYNNNTNGVDELLAYGRLQFSQLLTYTNTQTKLRLVNSLQQIIDSYLYIEHYDSNPRDLYLPLTTRSAIKLKLINELHQSQELICEYGEQSFSLRKEFAQNAFGHDPKEDSISFRLRHNIGNSKQELNTSVLVRNITQNSFFTLKFYSTQADIAVYLSASVVLAGLLPENHNILGVRLRQVQKSSGKKVVNLKVQVYGPLNSCSLEQQGKIYVQNNSSILVDYFEEIENTDGAQPYCSFKVPINSLNWEQSMKTSHSLKYYDNYKNVETIITFDFQLYKTTDISPVVPKINPPQQYIDQSSSVAVAQFTIYNCYLYEVLKTSTVQLYHIDLFNQVKTIQRFQLRENKAEYLIDSKILLRNGGKGCLYLICLDYRFDDNKEAAFDNQTVFKVNLEGVKSFQESRVEFNHKFLAFAKKNSVVNICKKFNQMVHDSLCTIKAKVQPRGSVKKGTFKIINMKFAGPFGDAEVRLRVDGTQFQTNGQINSYLMERPFQIEVDNGNTHIYSTIVSIQKGSNDKGNKTECSLYGSFQEFFGTPDKHKTYTYELKMSSVHKLQIVYTYEPSAEKFSPKRLQSLSLFPPSTSLNLKLVRAFTPISNQTYRFTVNRASYSYSSLSYKTHNSKIYFNPCQRLQLKAQANTEQQLIFFSAQSHDEQNNLMIYNGYTGISSILGRGQYEVTLAYQKQDKRKEIFLGFEVLHSLPLKISGIKLKLNQLSFSKQSNIVRTIYKYYLVVKINGFQYDIIECNIIDQSLKVNFGIALRHQDCMDVDLFSSFKAISKQLFHSTEKELIGRGSLHWEEIQQNSSIQLFFVPKKQHQLKSNKNSLISLEQTFKIALTYIIQPYNPEPRSQPLVLKRKTTDLDVLSAGLLKINLFECLPNYQNAIIVQIELPEWGLSWAAQSVLKLNQLCYAKAKNMEICIDAIMTLKDRDKYLKKSIKCRTSLRGKHYKIHQQIALSLNFEDQLMLKGAGTMFYNCFAGAPEGKLRVQQVAFRGVKIDRFELDFIENVSGSTDKVQARLKKEGYELKDLEVQFLTSDLLNGLYTLVEFKSQRYKFVLPLCQLPIDRYEQSQICQKQVLIGGEALVISFKLTYTFMKQTQKLQEQITYVALGTELERDLKVRYQQKEIAYFKENQSIKVVPKKTKGYACKVTIPEQLAPETTSIELYLQNGQNMLLTPSARRPCEYMYYTDKKYKAINLKVNHPQFAKKIVQLLGDSKGIDKFMIDQNSKYICTHCSEERQLLDIGQETWTFKFKLHRILALSGRRLLHLKNTVHDEVLTKNLALLIKHSDQYQLIFDLDQFGAIKDKEVQVQFGYNSNSQILEVYLIIDNYFNRKHQKNISRLMENWMELMPISYGAADLSDIVSNKYIAFKLQPLSNQSINLQKFISKLIVREDNIFALGGVTFQKKAWGYLSLSLLHCTAIELQRKSQKETVYIYFKVEVEDSDRTVLSTLTTQARSILPQKGIKFTRGSLQLFLIEQGLEPHYNLKISAYLLIGSNLYVLFQKRQDITDILHKRGQSQLNIQIKANQTNHTSKNSLQLTFSIENSSRRPESVDLIARAKEINKVDALSFRDMTGLQFLQKLLGCQQLSHFYQCLQEIKESFIYSEDPQGQLFILLCQYLAFNFDSRVLSLICEIIQLTVLKAPIVLFQMQKKGLIDKLYNQLKTICKSETPKIPADITKISHEDYSQALDLLKQKKSIEAIRTVILKQRHILYSSQRLLDRPSTQCNQLILMIMDNVLGNSAISRQAFHRDVEEWIEIFGFCQNQQEFQLFLLLFKNFTQHGLLLPNKALLRWIDILLQRVYRLTYVYDFWIKVEERPLKVEYYNQILLKYQSQLQVSPVQTCRGLKLMLSHLYDAKCQQQMCKIHQQMIKGILTSLQKSTDIVYLSSNIELLLHLNQMKILVQNERNMLANIIKEKSTSSKDSSSKIILGGFSAKLHKHKEIKLVAKKDGKGSDKMQKAGFRTKYLITND